MHREWWRSTSGEREVLLKGGVEKRRWLQADNARWEDEQHKEKSRYVV